jgi:hypothetical protein
MCGENSMQAQLKPTHPLFAEIDDIDLRAGDYHLPQYISATPDDHLPVNGFTWKIPDEKVMKADRVEAVIEALLTDSRVDFIAFQGWRGRFNGIIAKDFDNWMLRPGNRGSIISCALQSWCIIRKASKFSSARTEICWFFGIRT